MCTSRRPRNCRRKGVRKPEALPRKCDRKVEALPQWSPNKGKRRHEHNALRPGWRKLDAPSRVDRTEGRLVTWDPAGRPPGEEIFGCKGPVKANKNDTADIDARKQNRETWSCKSKVSDTAPATERTTHLYKHRPIPPSRSPPDFCFDAHTEGRASQSSWETQRPR